MTVIVGLAFLAACAKKDAATDTTAAAAPPPAAPVMAVRIVSPLEGDTVRPAVSVVLSAEGVKIEKTAGTRVDGVGHYHLFLDSPPTPEDSVIPPNSGTIVHIGTGDSTYTFKSLAPGSHQIIVAVGYGNHALMSTRRDTVKFIVKR